jgi:hypothetical protein
MKSIVTRLAALALFLAVTGAGAVARGLYWESAITSVRAEGTDTMKSWYMPRMMKIQTNKEGEYVILRLDKEKLVMVKDKPMTYSEMTFAEMEQNMKQTNAQMDKAMEQMKDMPKEQREMMEKMLGKSAEKKKTKTALKKIRETKRVGGFACTRYKIMRDTNQIADMWVTKDIRGFEAMRNDLKAFSRRMTSMNPGMGGDLAEAMENVDGFPMESTTAGIKTVVTKVEPKMTPLSEFEIPTGYKKVSMQPLEGKNE